MGIGSSPNSPKRDRYFESEEKGNDQRDSAEYVQPCRRFIPFHRSTPITYEHMYQPKMAKDGRLGEQSVG
jgi:hypothetical protein